MRLRRDAGRDVGGWTGADDEESSLPKKSLIQITRAFMSAISNTW
jgi:hypothetical protein